VLVVTDEGLMGMEDGAAVPLLDPQAMEEGQADADGDAAKLISGECRAHRVGF
jgi:hypothetical protein